jgi:hypothetical protein
MAGSTSLALMAAGTASSTVGSYYSAKSQKSQLSMQADIAEANAAIAEVGAQSELARGQKEEQSVRMRTAQIKSSQRVALAANGVDLGEGSAADILDSTDLMGEVDAQTVRSNAIRSAWGYRTQGMNQRVDAVARRGTAAGISPGMAAATSLLGGATDVSSTWYTMNKTGAVK